MLVLITLLVVLALCIQFVPRFPFGPLALYGGMTPEERAAAIPFKTLTDERSYPFRSAGSSPQILAAVERWPDVRDCLVASEQGKSKPDLRLIDWDLFRTYDEARVCLWRIFSSLGTPQRTLAWLKFHDPTESELEKFENDVRFGSNAMKEYRKEWQITSKYSYISRAAWLTRKVRRRVPQKGFASFFGQYDIAAQGIWSIWDDDYVLKGVSIRHSRL